VVEKKPRERKGRGKVKATEPVAKRETGRLRRRVGNDFLCRGGKPLCKIK